MKKKINIQDGGVRVCKSIMVCFYKTIAHFEMKKYKYGNDLANMNIITIHIYMMESITLQNYSIKFRGTYIMPIYSIFLSLEYVLYI